LCLDGVTSLHRQSERMATPDDPQALQHLLDQLPGSVEPLDVVMLDGFLCAVLLRERPLPAQSWLPFVFDIEGRPAPGSDLRSRLRAALLSRRDALARAIAAREWFDPWVFELRGAERAADAVLPWAAGFALADERFEVGNRRDPAARRALAQVYQFLDRDDWPAARLLDAEIGELEPPTALADAVEDLVSAVLLLADAVGLPQRGGRSAGD
jgi:uncharacterized protein